MTRANHQVFQIDAGETEARGQALAVAAGKIRLVGVTPAGEEVKVAPALEEAFVVTASGLGEGHPMVVLAADSASPTQAAKMLGVSRPMVTRWIAEGRLPDVPVGSHHRIPVAAILALRESRIEAGRRAMALLAEAEGEPEAAARVEAAREAAQRRIAARATG
jgi:excisionase family DNA binding protein